MSGVIDPTRRLVPGLIEKITPQTNAAGSGKQVSGGKFSDLISDMIQSVNQAQKDSGQAQEAFLAGEPVELHDVMIKAEKAGISMDLLLEIRNKLVAAYQEIMRMPM